jgi:hypothetical protein
MKRLILTAAALALLTTTAPANACDPTAFCNGVIAVGGGWVTIDKVPYCRLKVGSAGAKEVLKTCPVGSRCHAEIHDDDDWCYVTRNVNKFPEPSYERKED